MTTLTDRPATPAAAVDDPGTAPGRPADDPRWARPALAVLLLGTAVLYLWDLSASGWANSFYAAAAQAGSESWKAFLFGSSDAANAITVDKPPASLWVMSLSIRAFGLSSWSLLVPQALMGVATVAILHQGVKRWFGAVAGLLAGLVLALTPVAALMFRFDNPDALLVLLMTAAAYALVRALEAGSTRWVLLVGVLLGLGFLTKSLQVLLVVPGLGLAYLLCARTTLRRRLWQAAACAGAFVVSAGWWVALVELWPASSRPYVGGSQTNSVWELIWGYNGLGRLTGDETGSVTGGGGGTGGPGGAGASMWGETGIGRLFSADWGGQVSWLVPAALVLLGGLVWLAVREWRLRAVALVWGGWLLVTGLTLSFMQGIVHQYYAVALAPAVAALVGVGAAELWRRRDHLVAAGLLAASLLVTAVWAFVLLGRSGEFLPWLRWLVLGLGVVAAAGLAVLAWRRPGGRLGRRLGLAVAVAGLVTALAGPTAYAVETAATPHTGSIVTAGPTVAGGSGPGGQGGPGGPGGFPGGGTPPQGTTGGTPPQGMTGGTPPQGMTAGTPPQGTTGGAGGLLESSEPSQELVDLLSDDASSYTWVAAAVGSNAASGYQLATEDPVMAIGGFNGSDPSPTLEQFEAYVAAGEIHYFVAGGASGASNGGSDAAQQIAAWVADHYDPTTVDGVTVYDLSS